MDNRGVRTVLRSNRRLIVGGALTLSVALALSGCGRKAGPYAPPPPDPATVKSTPLLKIEPDGSRSFVLDPLLKNPPL